MENASTVDHLFELSIAAERAAEELYRELAARFAAYTEVAEFWNRMAAEERGHAHKLEQIRAHLSPSQLAEAADSEILRHALRALEIPVLDLLAGVGDLEAAYLLMCDLENSETNAVFEFLITHFAYNPDLLPFLKNQLRLHLNRLMEIPERFGDGEQRRRIKAASASGSSQSGSQE